MSKFDKHLAKALNVQHRIMGDMAIVKIKDESLSISVIVDEDFGVVNEKQDMYTVICIKKSDLSSKPPSSMVIEVNDKTYKVDGLFIGQNYESDQYEWCIAVREV